MHNLGSEGTFPENMGFNPFSGLGGDVFTRFFFKKYDRLIDN